MTVEKVALITAGGSGGLAGWLAVGVLWNDRALMLIHAVALIAMFAGLSSR